MRPSDVQDLYELAPLQQGILFHCLAAEDPGLYLITMSYGLDGPLDGPLFLRAWQRVVERNPVLRTSFHWKDIEKPLQLVHREAELGWAQLDWSGLPPEEQEARLTLLMEKERRREFQLDRAPLMRLTLVRLGAERHRLIWVFHHIVMEGWSAALVLQEAFAIYQARQRGETVEPPPRRPYRDHVLWLQERELSRAETHWRRELEGFSAPTPLPLAREGSPGAAAEGYGRQSMVLSAEASGSLGSLARSHRLTMSTLLQGAWAVLLGRHADEEDVLFGCLVSGRQDGLPEAESMVGLFVNTLATRVKVSRDARILPWLQSLQRRLVEAREFEWSPLPQVQGWSGVPRGTPLFQTILAFENWAGDLALREGAGELTVQDVRPAEGGTGYPLLVEAAAGARVSAALTYSRRHYDDEAVTQLLARYRRLLEGFVARPEGTLAELPLIDEAERARLVVSASDTAIELPGQTTLQHLLERPARETPHAVAVALGAESLTHGELDRRSSQLAHHLRGLGVRAEARVGICCERSLDLAVGLLGILKAGGAYVPLDPSHPAERLAFVLEDSGADVVVTQQHLLDRLPRATARTVSLDADWPIIAREPTAGPADHPGPESLAYLIHTSGSTGRPKGVQVPHRAVVSFLEAMRRELDFGADDVLLSVTTPSFDIFALELFLPLTVGARVVLVSQEVASDGEALGQELVRAGATAMQSTPATWGMLLDAGWAGNPRMKLLCGGEAMPPELARQLLSRGAALWNLYGPTETTVWSAVHRVETVDGRVPLGRPIANTRVYVLDAGGNPTPAGVPGELCIGGAGVARGYLNQPRLTAERFVPDPFGPSPGSRLYRTGDRVRWRPDGRLDFLGRIDQQVKIRGFRVEPGEVEAALRRHPEVREATVVAREEQGGGTRLVAYMVSRNGQPAPTDELRAFLSRGLPEYMVPSVFMMLPAMPLTPSGKVDRRALPAPGQARPELSRGYVGPRTPAEEAVAAIWRDALGLDRVGIHDNFFDLGGHSLLLVRVHARLKQEFPGRGLAVADLFRHATVAGLAQLLSGEPATTSDHRAEDAQRLRTGRQRLGLRREARAAPGAGERGGR